MPHIADDRVGILKLLMTIVVAISVSNGMLAQNATIEYKEPNNTATNLNSSDAINDESDIVMTKQQLNATLRHNTLDKELSTIDQRIKDIEQGRDEDSPGLITTKGSQPVTVRELQKRRKQIIKELSKLKSGNKSESVEE